MEQHTAVNISTHFQYPCKCSSEDTCVNSLYDISVQLFIDSITIKVLSDEELKTKALKAKQEWYQCHPCSLNGDWIDEPYMKNAYTANEETINRWIVNYIRHNLVSYDNFLGSIDGKVGSVEAYPEVKIAVLEKIANTYPKYKDECERQIFFVDFNADR